jgi:hypothetical protein
MKSQFAIFGLERMADPNSNDERSGQPYLFRKYPEQFESINEAQEELKKIMESKSPFIHYQFSNYVILEVFSRKHSVNH